MGIFHCYVSLPEGTKKTRDKVKKPTILEAVNKWRGIGTILPILANIFMWVMWAFKLEDGTPHLASR